MSMPLPPWLTPAQRAVYIATAHLCDKTMADATAEECALVRADARVQQAEARVTQCTSSGDEIATKEACQSWNLAHKRALAALRKLVAA